MLFTSHSKARLFCCSHKEQVDIHVRRAAVLRALPAYLHEDDSGFLKQRDVSQYIIYFIYFWSKSCIFFFYSNPVNLYFYKLKKFQKIAIKIVVIIEWTQIRKQACLEYAFHLWMSLKLTLKCSNSLQFDMCCDLIKMWHGKFMSQ